MSSQPRTHRGQRDRNGDGRYHRDHEDRNGDGRYHRDHEDRNGDGRYHRDHEDRNGDGRYHEDRRSSPDRSSSHPPYYPREAGHSSKNDRDGKQLEHRESDSKCTNMCSRRGIVLICAVLTNALVLICIIASHMVTSGMSAAASMGGFNINSNFNLQGTELQKVRELDMQYSQMRAPGIYGGIPFSLTFGVVSLLFVVSGNKPPHRMSKKLLVGALIFQAVGAVAYIVAVGLYLHFIIRVNSTDVCQQRERLYARNGYTWMNCDVSGADAAVALFGLITAILYTAGTVLTIQTIRIVKHYLQERKRRQADRPLRADTTAV